jgi:hypothetical protein
MTSLAAAFTMMIALSGNVSTHSVNPGSGQPLKYFSSCEIDLNSDREADIAMLVETVRGPELLALMKTAKGYNTFVLSTGKQGMYLNCRYGDTVMEHPLDQKKTDAERTHKTPGTYLVLSQPEGASVAYFWNGSGFTEVWTSD